jgi:hypothetical protein
VGDFADALGRITYIGTAALVFIVVMKIVMARFPVPGLRDVVAMA